MSKRINPAVLPHLENSLVNAFWYKKQLRSFLCGCLPDEQIISRLDWDATKRTIVGGLLEQLVNHQPKTRDTLIDLMLSVSDIDDPNWLKQLDDGDVRYHEAVQSLSRLRAAIAPYSASRSEQEEQARLAKAQSVRDAEQRAMIKALGELREILTEISLLPPHERGYAFEHLLNRLFTVMDITSRSAFRTEGEQIDGSFSLDRQDFLVEAKWTTQLVTVADLDSFSAKVGRKIDNTLGLFVAINGFQESAISRYSQQRSSVILMDGADLYAVLDSRIDFVDLIDSKRRHAAQTGCVFLPVHQILGR